MTTVYTTPIKKGSCIRVPHTEAGKKYAWIASDTDNGYNEVFNSIEECIADAKAKYAGDDAEMYFPIKDWDAAELELTPMIDIGTVYELNMYDLEQEACAYASGLFRDGEQADVIADGTVDYVGDYVNEMIESCDDEDGITVALTVRNKLYQKISKAKTVTHVRHAVKDFIKSVEFNRRQYAQPFYPRYNVEDGKWYDWRTNKPIS